VKSSAKVFEKNLKEEWLKREQDENEGTRKPAKRKTRSREMQRDCHRLAIGEKEKQEVLREGLQRI